MPKKMLSGTSPRSVFSPSFFAKKPWSNHWQGAKYHHRVERPRCRPRCWCFKACICEWSYGARPLGWIWKAESGIICKSGVLKSTILHGIWRRSLVFFLNERLIFPLNLGTSSLSCLDEDICWWGLSSYQEVRIRSFSSRRRFQARRKQPLPSAKLKTSWSPWRCHFGIQEGLSGEGELPWT